MAARMKLSITAARLPLEQRAGDSGDAFITD
jgi:hypothetical protein